MNIVLQFSRNTTALFSDSRKLCLWKDLGGRSAIRYMDGLFITRCRVVALEEIEFVKQVSPRVIYNVM